uniref:Aminopeptidase n=1 Tax=Biomphalaria glabrata TaxID=6526 RepID=A0A2C9JE86_BIOGL
MDHEVEEVSFLPGEAILNKKAVYEPTKGQRFRQVVCSKGWAICILLIMGAVMVAVAVIAAFARPASIQTSNSCKPSPSSEDSSGGSTVGPENETPQTYIATNGQVFPWKDLRLPRTIKPLSYHIFLHPNLSESYFAGWVQMNLHVLEDTNYIVFHSHELNLSSVTLHERQPGGGKELGRELRVVQELEYTRNNQYYVRVDSLLRAGLLLQLNVSFRGSLESLSRMSGFYKSTYTVKEETRYMASTQFEATFARSAFPCFDEPELKANFSMSIVRSPQHISLFNTRLIETKLYRDSLWLDVYEDSVKMSTYLVAYVICDFKNISKMTKDNVQVRLFAPEDKIYMGQYALNAAVTVLEYYNSFFGIHYPLSKLDLIAVPNFAAGAMENWGLITYRDTSILYDPAKSTESTKMWVTLVVAHELAHQWFGNLVTMKWWNDLWLNEGFATYVEYIGADQVDKDFQMMDSFMMPFSGAQHLDSLITSHPIEVEVQDPAEVDALFDKISYDKGACLIRMLQHFIGEDKFKTALSNYLKSHAYDNAQTQDLWDAMDSVSTNPQGLKVSMVMDTWTKQMGYPVVTVTREQDYLVLKQDRFLMMDNFENKSLKSDKSPFNYTWYIPFTYKTSSNPDKSHLVWMKRGSATEKLPDSSAIWIKGNVDTYGYYRVNYDKDGWQAIIQQLKTNHSVFSITDKVGLFNDAFSLARTGLISYTIPLDMTKYLINESNYFVWEEVLTNMYFVCNQLKLEEELDLLQTFVLSLAQHLIDELGWADTGKHLTKKLRASMIYLSLTMNYQPVMNEAYRQFIQWTIDKDFHIHSDLRGAVYSTGLKNSTKEVWDLVMERYLTANIPSEKILLLSSLAASTNSRILQILLEYSLDDSKVKSQSTTDVLSSVAANDNGLLVTWRFVRERWDIIFERYGESSFLLSDIIKSVIQPFNSQFDYDEVVAFFKNRDLGSGKMALRQALEVVQSHIVWVKRNMQTVKDWLKANVKKSKNKIM